ncbi:MAG: type II toxin-antitoxin system death-on-curing family toxin [Myxococcales bacterium]|nr:type II toxin-antitoxin system death-on-curing family toxin [Myxococcales bacterium]
MGEIIFLTLEELLALYDDLIAFAGGDSGVRSIELVQSAIAQPEAGFAGQLANAFPFGMAAAYAYHLSRNHPFVDGNTRVGLSAAVVFLFMNGWELVDPDETLHRVMEDVAQGKIDKPALAAVFEKLARKLE